MPLPETLEARIVNLETIVAQQDRLLDELNTELLRLNRLHDRLTARLDEHETRQDADAQIRLLSEEPPPPHY